MKFVLFDIDGTLLDSGGAGTKAMNAAFQEMFSIADAFRSVSMAGKTDLQIFNEGLEANNISVSDDLIPRFFRTYMAHLKSGINRSNGHVKTGVRAALQKLHQEKDIVLGLLTGNYEEGANIKLSFFGLASYFSIGAFGNDNHDRNLLLPIAVEKLHKKNNIRIDFRDCIVIGDTPRDIDCSKPYGAFSIAVATGPYSFEALSDAGADLVLHDLSDTERLISILQNGSGNRIHSL